MTALFGWSVAHADAAEKDLEAASKPEFDLPKQRLKPVIWAAIARKTAARKDIILANTLPCYEQAFSDCVYNALYMGTRLRLLAVPGVWGVFDPSRSFGYANGRRVVGDLCKDDGSSVTDAVFQQKTVGMLAESAWPYTSEHLHATPTQDKYLEAQDNRLDGAYRITAQGSDRLDSIDDALGAGVPVVWASPVSKAVTQYESNEPISERDAITNPLGGHAMLLVGVVWMAGLRRYLVQNSWGPKYGTKHPVTGEGGYLWADERWIRSVWAREFFALDFNGDRP